VRRLGVVLWSGVIGGAETYTADLIRAMRARGADVGVVFVTTPEPLSSRLASAGVPCAALGLMRGRHIVAHARRFAETLSALGPDGALLPDGGYLARALRVGGYRSPIVAVAHGATLELGPLSPYTRIVRSIDRALGYPVIDAEVAVSDFALSHVRRRRGSRRVVRIYNGIDLEAYGAAPGPAESGGAAGVSIAAAARLVDGKGLDVLLRAFAACLTRARMRLSIAGDGPDRETLQRLAVELGLDGMVAFPGLVLDMPSFWHDCDIAVMPSDRSVESFGMAAVEAMACSRPVVASANGALPELVDDTVGALVPPGDVPALAAALLALAADGERRLRAGRAARARCEERFDIRTSAADYLRLFEEFDSDVG
jgi:glycosyltransferase involved in cell wall biosynthesis